MKQNTLQQIDCQIDENRKSAISLSRNTVYLNGTKTETFQVKISNEASLSIEELETVLDLAKTNYELLQLRALAEKHLPGEFKNPQIG